MTRWLWYALAGLLVATPMATPGPAPAPVVEVVGDLAHAERIAVIVPGVGVTPGNFRRGLGGVLRRAPAWQAGTLRAASGPRVAVVAWLGYQPPAGVGWDAVRSERAVAGAAALVRYVRQLPAAATVTLIGHSYGSLVLAYAAPQLPARVTDLVALGSPGIDVGHASELGTTARVWAGRAEDDWIRWVPEVRLLGLGHGADPADPGYGARRLDVSGAPGHDGYFLPGSRSLRSLAAVVNGAGGRARAS